MMNLISQLESAAVLMGLGSAEIQVLPAVIERTAQMVEITPAEMLEQIRTNEPLRAYIRTGVVTVAKETISSDGFRLGETLQYRSGRKTITVEVTEIRQFTASGLSAAVGKDVNTGKNLWLYANGRRG